MKARILIPALLAGAAIGGTLVSQIESDATPLAATEAEMGLASFEVLAQTPYTFEGTSYDRELLLHGNGFYGTSVGPFVHVDGVESRIVEILSPELVKIALPESTSGAVRVRVTNPDGRFVEIDAQL